MTSSDLDTAAYVRETLHASGLEPRQPDVERLAASHGRLRETVDAMWQLREADDVTPPTGFTARAPRSEWPRRDAR